MLCQLCQFPICFTSSELSFVRWIIFRVVLDQSFTFYIGPFWIWHFPELFVLFTECSVPVSLFQFCVSWFASVQMFLSTIFWFLVYFQMNVFRQSIFGIPSFCFRFVILKKCSVSDLHVVGLIAFLCSIYRVFLIQMCPVQTCYLPNCSHSDI